MSLEQTLIAEAERECGARLAAIEQAAGLIVEAETLAATLRHHGIADASAVGCSTGLMSAPAIVHCWVNVSNASPQALFQALRDADLRIKTFSVKTSESFDVQIDGLSVTLSVWAGHTLSNELLRGLLSELKSPEAPIEREAAHG